MPQPKSTISKVGFQAMAHIESLSHVQTVQIFNQEDLKLNTEQKFKVLLRLQISLTCLMQLFQQLLEQCVVFLRITRLLKESIFLRFLGHILEERTF